MSGPAKHRPLTLLESEGDGVIVDGHPWSVWLAIEDGRRDKAPTVALWRDKTRFEIRTDVQWSIKEWGRVA